MENGFNTTAKITGDRIKQYLRQGKRFDERNLDEFRELSIETNVSKNAEGSARVKVGQTEVIVGVKLDVAEPYPDSLDQGNLMVTAELLPLSSPRFETGPPKFEAIELGRVLDRVIRESKFIDLKKLCIKEGEKAWTVFIDIYSINDDGNLLDAAGIGIIAALKTARMPKYDETEGKVVFGELTEHKIPLSKEIPISITIYKIGDSLVVDPTKEEEDVSDTRVTVGSTNGIISSMQKGNSIALEVKELYEILDLIEASYKKILPKIEKFLK